MQFKRGFIHLPVPNLVVVYGEVREYASRSDKHIRITPEVGLQYTSRQNKLLALCPNGQHICVNGVWLDIVRVKITVRIIDHVTQILCGSPSSPCFIQITEAVVVDYVFVVNDSKHGLRLYRHGCCICQSDLVVLFQQKVACYFLYAHLFLYAKPCVLYRYIIAHLKHACIGITAKFLKKVEPIQCQRVLSLCLCRCLEIFHCCIPQSLFCLLLVAFGQIYVGYLVGVSDLNFVSVLCFSGGNGQTSIIREWNDAEFLCFVVVATFRLKFKLLPSQPPRSECYLCTRSVHKVHRAFIVFLVKVEVHCIINESANIISHNSRNSTCACGVDVIVGLYIFLTAYLITKFCILYVAFCIVSNTDCFSTHLYNRSV